MRTETQETSGSGWAETDMDCDIAGWAQVVLEGLALVLGLLYYFGEYRRDRNNRKKNVLASIRIELKQNWQYMNNPPLLPEEEYHPEYYDPTRQVFKYRDDAITAALCSDIISSFDKELVEALLYVSQSVRFVNQQIDELMAFRFGSPEMLATAVAKVREDRKCLTKYAQSPGQIPKRFRDYLQELALRHWAIVNEGYWRRLRPAIEEATRQLPPALKDVEPEEVRRRMLGDWLLSAKTGSTSTALEDEH